jgi:hypothetical protein
MIIPIGGLLVNVLDIVVSQRGCKLCKTEYRYLSNRVNIYLVGL